MKRFGCTTCLGTIYRNYRSFGDRIISTYAKKPNLHNAGNAGNAGFTIFGGCLIGGFGMALTSKYTHDHNIFNATLFMTTVGATFGGASAGILALTIKAWLPVVIYGVIPILTVTTVCVPVNLFRRKRNRKSA